MVYRANLHPLDQQTLLWKYIMEHCPTNLDGSQGTQGGLLQARGYLEGHPFLQTTPPVRYVDYRAIPSDILTSLPEELWLLQDGEFLLSERWVTPITLPDGRVLAFVGWRPGQGNRMKYLTTPSGYFKRSLNLFGISEALSLLSWGTSAQSLMVRSSQVRTSSLSQPALILTEGIFDTLALQSLGIPSVAIMGKRASMAQKAQYNKLGIPVLAILDKDAVEDVLPYNTWGLDFNKGSKYITWDSSIPAKDADDLVNLFGDSLIDLLSSSIICPDSLVRFSL